MKGQLRTATIAVILSFLFSTCKDDDGSILNIPENLDITSYAPENFTDLSLQEFKALETPLESILGGIIPNGRVSSHLAFIDEIAHRLEEVFSGVAIEIRAGEERGLAVWEIEIKFEGGGKIEIVIVQEAGKILEIEGQAGPFDFDVDPEGSFISLNEAIEIAHTVMEGELERWELELEENNRWEWELHLINGEGRWEIEIDAFTGEILGIKRKDGDKTDEPELEDPGDPAPDNVIEFALEIVPGEVVHSEMEREDDLTVWEVYIRTEVGSIVKLKILQTESLSLFKIKGKEPPFDYEVNLGDDFVPFDEAKAIVHQRIDSEISEWQLFRRHRSDEAFWIYKFELIIGDAQAEILINALTGEIINLEVDHADKDIDEDIEEDKGDQNGDDTDEEADGANEDDGEQEGDGQEEGENMDDEEQEGDGENGDDGEQEGDGENGDDGEQESDGEGDGENGETDGDGENGGEEDGDNSETGPEIPEEVLHLVRTILDGEIIEPEVFEDGDRSFIRLYVRGPEGAVVKIVIALETLDVVKIEIKEGPFDIDLHHPHDALISVLQAIEIALETVHGEIVGWRLELEETDQGDLVWVFEFRIVINGTVVEITINGETGEVLGVDDGAQED